MWNFGDQFARNQTGWLTFFTTSTLGATTAYFAWRTRQMQRAQLRQFNRQADQELADAEAELNKALLAPFYWNSWKEQSDISGALALYADVGANIAKPDLPKTVRILGFYLPAAEQDASYGIIKLHATLQFIDMLASRRWKQKEIAAELAKGDAALQDVQKQLQKALDQVKKKRNELRRI